MKRLLLVLAVLATSMPLGVARADTVTWHKAGSYEPPVRRSAHVLSRDVTGRTILFGGLTMGSLGTVNTLHRFDGTRWMDVTPAVSPTPRNFSAIAYDPVREQTVLFGGYATDQLAETWVWDGVAWTQKHPTLSPPSRYMASMAWDEASGKVILFGGYTAFPGGAGVWLNDTWSWDGTEWSLEPVLLSPPPRSSFGFADGSSTTPPVLFGGLSGNQLLSDTWTYDSRAGTWRLAAVTGPGGRQYHDFAFDPRSGRAILHAGTTRHPARASTSGVCVLCEEPLGDTWAWDGVAWTELNPAQKPAPPSRFQAPLAYDAVDQRVRLFGGFACTPSSSGCLGGWSQDTWSFDGSTWIDDNQLAPQPFHKAAAAPDASGGVVVFGGLQAAGTASRETWRWSEGSWERLFPAQQPVPRSAAAMAYMPTTGQTLLFSGNIDTLGLPGARQIGDTTTADTWSWNGAEWNKLAPATSPTARSNAMIAYDAARDEIVLFGGGSNGNAKNDTWIWNGTTWIERFPAVSPPARFGGQLAYDPVSERVVLFGGVLSKSTGTLNDTWAWDGSAWSQVVTTPVKTPAARGYGALAFDPSSQRLVMFGGCSGCYGNPTYDETWAFDGTGWTQLTPEASPERMTGPAAVSGDATRPLTLFGGRRAVLSEQGGFAIYPEGTEAVNSVYEFRG